MASQKIKHAIIMHITNDSVVQRYLFENEYLSYENLILVMQICCHCYCHRSLCVGVLLVAVAGVLSILSSSKCVQIMTIVCTSIQ